MSALILASRPLNSDHTSPFQAQRRPPGESQRPVSPGRAPSPECPLLRGRLVSPPRLSRPGGAASPPAPLLGHHVRLVYICFIYFFLVFVPASQCQVTYKLIFLLAQEPPTAGQGELPPRSHGGSSAGAPGRPLLGFLGNVVPAGARRAEDYRSRHAQGKGRPAASRDRAVWLPCVWARGRWLVVICSFFAAGTSVKISTCRKSSLL